MRLAPDPIFIALSTELPPPLWLRQWAEREEGEVLDHAPGAASLRQILVRDPELILLHLGRSARVDSCASWVAELHRRRQRLLLVTLVSCPDDDAERALRAAGVSMYLSGEAEVAAVGETLANLRRRRPGRERAPPGHRIRGRPPPATPRSRTDSTLSAFAPFEEDDP